MIPESSWTGQVIKSLDVERHLYSTPVGTQGLIGLLDKIGHVVMIYLTIPAGVVALGTLAIVIDISVETVTYFRGKQTGREWRTHVVAFAILFVSLPFRVVGYWVGKRDLLFPIDYRHKNPPNPTTPDPTLSYREFRVSAELCVLQNSPTYLLNLLDFPRVTHCDLGKIMLYAIEKRNKPLVNKLTEQGQSIHFDIGDQWWDRKTPLEKILKEAESLSNPDRQEALDFAAFLVDEKKANLNTPEIERMATKHNQDIDIVRFLCKRGHVSSNNYILVDLYLRLKDPELLSAFVDQHPKLSGWDRGSALNKIMPFAVQEKNATLAKKILRKGYDITNYFTVNGSTYTSLIGHIHTQVKNPRHSEQTRQEWLNFAKEILLDYFSSEKNRTSWYSLLNSNDVIELCQLIKDPAIFLCILKTSHYFSTNECGKMLELAVREACSPSHPVAVRITWREVLAILITKGTIAPNKRNEFMDIARSVRDLEAGRLICRLGEMQFLSEAVNKATIYTQFDHLRFLLELQVNLNVHFSDGDTPLIKAVRSGKVDLVRMLLADSRLDRNLPRTSSSFFDFRGKTALQIAKDNGYIEIVRLLSDGKAEPKPGYEPPKSSSTPHVPSALKIPYFPPDLFPLDLCKKASEVKPKKEQTTPFEKSRLAEFLSQIALGSKTPPYWGIFGVIEDEAVTMGSEAFNTRTKNLIVNIHHDQNRALEGEDKVFCEQVYQAVFEVRRKLLGALKELEQIAKNRA